MVDVYYNSFDYIYGEELKIIAANPLHRKSDFYEKDSKIEIRILWQLLNVMDPSTKSIMADLYKNNGIKVMVHHF